MPKLENTMNNYIGCTAMLFGSMVKYGVTYKQDLPGFELYKRKYTHDFKNLIVDENFNKSYPLEVEIINSFLVSKNDKIMLFNSDTYAITNEFKIKIHESTTREQNQILSMKMCEDEEYLAIISGKLLIKNEQQPNQLDIFIREGKDFLHKSTLDLYSIKEFIFVSMDFYFMTANTKGDPTSVEKTHLIFAK
jgi:hypothetical protein